MFLTIKPKIFISLILILILSFTITFCLYNITTTSAEPKFNYTIVVDAGHGGRDAGASGINTGVKESDLSLAISQKLRDYLSNFGFKVVMTRETQAGLYSENAKNFKKDDMAKREKIINKINADMIISIHLNSFPSISEKGAQAFFEDSNENSILLSNAVQKQLINNLPDARKSANKGDYYILKSKNVPCSLIECGFLSNPDEEALLTTQDYQQEVAYAIFCGIIDYYNQTSDLLTNSEFKSDLKT